FRKKMRRIKNLVVLDYSRSARHRTAAIASCTRCGKLMPTGRHNSSTMGGNEMRIRLLTTVTATLLATTAAFAQNAADNLERLGQFKTTGAAPNIPTVPQGGAKADALKRNLAKIKVPVGFHIDLYALVPDARHLAVGPQGVVTFVGTRKNRVYAVTD